MKKFLLFFALILSTTVINAQKTPCKGIKKDKTQCKITAVNADGYCRWHDPKATHCTFIKKDKTQCKMIVKAPDTLCRYHGGKKD